jgi:hypothetical protein
VIRYPEITKKIRTPRFAYEGATVDPLQTIQCPMTTRRIEIARRPSRDGIRFTPRIITRLNASVHGEGFGLPFALEDVHLRQAVERRYSSPGCATLHLHSVRRAATCHSSALLLTLLDSRSQLSQPTTAEFQIPVLQDTDPNVHTGHHPSPWSLNWTGYEPYCLQKALFLRMDSFQLAAPVAEEENVAVPELLVVLGPKVPAERNDYL